MNALVTGSPLSHPFHIYRTKGAQQAANDVVLMPHGEKPSTSPKFDLGELSFPILGTPGKKMCTYKVWQ